MNTPRGFSVFLSYASEDRAEVEKIAATLRDAGIDVWFDQKELRGGDAWDAEIRARINDCTFFVPIISRSTQARAEGYFRREWKMGIERSEGMADDRPFIMPVNFDAIPEAQARVPARFRALHWLTVPRGDPGTVLAQRLDELNERVSHPPFEFAIPGRAGRAARRRLILGWPSLAVAVLLAAAGTWWALAARARAPGTETIDPALVERTVAVLPFVNLGVEQPSDYFSDGLTEELSAVLARSGALRVVARTSAYAFKGRSATVQQIGTQLRAGTLVEGTVQRLDGRIKVIVHLVNAAAGFRIFTQDYDYPLSEVFTAPGQVARDLIARLLPTAPLPPVPARPLTRNADAYDAFLRGRSFQLKPPTKENLEQAAKFFRIATEQDAQFAIAWARYGEVLTRAVTLAYDDSAEARKTAHHAIDQALQLDGGLPEAHRALANYHNIDWTQQELASRELLLAARATPDDADLLSALAANSFNRGKKQAALDYLKRALALDPQNADLAINHAMALDFASRYEEAVAEAERAFRIGGWIGTITQKTDILRNWKGDLKLAMKTLQLAEPKGPGDPEGSSYWRVRVGYELAQGDFAAANASLARITPEILPTALYYSSKSFLAARIHEAQGQETEARAAYTRALPEVERYRDEQPKRLRAHTTLALVYAGLGRFDEARAAAKRCLELVPANDNPYGAARTGWRVLAQVEARAGNIDAALEIVRAQIAAGFWKRNDLLLDNDWAVLRKDSRFMDIARAAPL